MSSSLTFFVSLSDYHSSRKRCLTSLHAEKETFSQEKDHSLEMYNALTLMSLLNHAKITATNGPCNPLCPCLVIMKKSSFLLCNPRSTRSHNTIN